MKVGIIYSLVKDDTKDAESFNEVMDTVNKTKLFLKKNNHEVILCKLDETSFENAKNQISKLKEEVDFVFNYAESLGEDTSVEWKIAKMMSDINLSYTGANWKCLKVTTNKINMKKKMVKANIPTPKYQIFESVDDKMLVPYPVIIKPSRENGSMGIFSDSVAHNDEELKKCVNRILVDYKQPALVEEFIDEREFQVGIIAGNPQIVLPIAELFYTLPEGQDKILTYDGKWTEDSLEYKGTNTGAPINLSKVLEEKLVENAKKAHKLFGSPDYCRVDFRTKGEEVYVLELNANPCINPKDSGFSKQLKRAKIRYNHFMQIVFDLTLKKKEKSQKIIVPTMQSNEVSSTPVMVAPHVSN
jgi:D-alanine-D-alanine ligase